MIWLVPVKCSQNKYFVINWRQNDDHIHGFSNVFRNIWSEFEKMAAKMCLSWRKCITIEILRIFFFVIQIWYIHMDWCVYDL